MKKKSVPTGIIIVIVLAAWLFKSYQPAAPETSPADAHASATVSFPGNEPLRGRQPDMPPAGPREFAPYQVSGVRIVDIHTGKTVNVHTVDLRPTLERIASGVKNSHRNDGSVFRNSARKLPKQPTGYYHEYVVPTEGIRGPGPQRLVMGREGEIYYTCDHYESFIELKGERKP